MTEETLREEMTEAVEVGIVLETQIETKDSRRKMTKNHFSKTIRNLKRNNICLTTGCFQ